MNNNIMNLELMKKYILENYKIEFIDDEYGYSKAISYVDKRRKMKYYLHLSEYYDKSSKYIGFDKQNIKTKSGYSGPVSYIEEYINSFYKAIDFIMEELYDYEKLKEKQLDIFDCMKE